MGIIYWITVNFTDPEYYASYTTLCLPIHLELLREIVYRHPLQRIKVLELLSASFEMETGLEAVNAVRNRFIPCNSTSWN